MRGFKSLDCLSYLYVSSWSTISTSVHQLWHSRYSGILRPPCARPYPLPGAFFRRRRVTIPNHSLYLLAKSLAIRLPCARRRDAKKKPPNTQTHQPPSSDSLKGQLDTLRTTVSPNSSRPQAECSSSALPRRW